MTIEKYTEQPLGDFEFAAWLRAREAVDNFKHDGPRVSWYNPAGLCVAYAIYDNARCTRRVFILEGED